MYHAENDLSKFCGMNNLTLSGKWLIAVVFFLAANVMAITLLVAHKNEALSGLRTERKGLAYLQALRPLAEVVPQFRRAVTSVGAIAGEAADLETQVDAGLALLDRVDLLYGPELRTTADFIKLRKTWKAGVADFDPEKAASAASTVETSLRAMASLVGDTSALILDSELDAFYLADAIALRLPSTIEQLNRELDESGYLTPGATLTQVQRDRLLVADARLQESFAAVLSNATAVTSANAARGAVLEGVTKNLDRTVGLVHNWLKEEALPTNALPPSTKEFDDRLKAALTAASAFLETASMSLDARLEARIKEETSDRNRTIGYVAALAVAGMALGLWVGLTVSWRLRDLAHAIEQTTRGERSDVARDDAADEIGALVEALNHLLASRPPVGGSAHASASGDALVDENLRLKVLVADLVLRQHASPEAS